MARLSRWQVELMDKVIPCSKCGQPLGQELKKAGAIAHTSNCPIKKVERLKRSKYGFPVSKHIMYGAKKLELRSM